MKCKNCGNQIDDNAKFCMYCGGTTQNKSNSLETVEDRIVFFPSEENITLEKQNQPIPPNKNNNFLKILIGIILIFIILLSIIKISGFISDKKEADENNQNSVSQTEDTSQNQNSSGKNEIQNIKIVDQESSSILTDKLNIDYGPHRVLDDKVSTVWSEGVDGSGESEYIKLYFDSTYTISQIKIINGLVNSKNGYYKNNRPASLVAMFDDGSSEIIYLNDDTSEYQTINLNNPIKSSSITFTINTVYNGSKYDDTCIAEIRVAGYK